MAQADENETCLDCMTMNMNILRLNAVYGTGFASTGLVSTVLLVVAKFAREVETLLEAQPVLCDGATGTSLPQAWWYISQSLSMM